MNHTVLIIQNDSYCTKKFRQLQSATLKVVGHRGQSGRPERLKLDGLRRCTVLKSNLNRSERFAQCL